MKISTELRHIINSRFQTYNERRLSEKEMAKLMALAAKKNPAIQKALDDLTVAASLFRKAEDALAKFGINAYPGRDVETSLVDPDKLSKIVPLPPKPVTRNEVLHKLAQLSPKEGVVYLKTLGIDWS